MKNILFTIVLAFTVSTSRGLEIIEATYGNAEDKTDFKEALESIKRNDNFYYGKIDLNAVGKDLKPDPGKVITVRFKDAVDNEEKTFQFKDDEEIVIMDGMKLSNTFFICGAWYGGDKKFANVNGAIEYLGKKKRAFDISPRWLSGRKDPAPGVKKELILLASKDNKFITLKYPDGTKGLWTNEIDESLGKGRVPIAKSPNAVKDEEKKAESESVNK